MNWRIEGQDADDNEVALTVVGGAEDEQGATEALKGTHPGVKPTKFTPLDGLLQPLKGGHRKPAAASKTSAAERAAEAGKTPARHA